MKKNTRLAIGLGGCALLVLGCFAPIMHIPIVGDIPYASGDGKFVLALAALGAAGAIFGRFGLLWATGLGTLLLAWNTWMAASRALAEGKEKLSAELDGNMFAPLASLAMESIHMGWGWAPLLVGALLCLAAAKTWPQHTMGDR